MGLWRRNCVRPRLQAQGGLGVLQACCHLGSERIGALLSLHEHVWTAVKHP